MEVTINNTIYTISHGSCMQCEMEHGKDGYCLGRGICSVNGNSVYLKKK